MSAKLLATMTRMLFANIPHTAASREDPAPKLLPVTRMPGLRNCGWLSTKSGFSLPSSRRRARMNNSAFVVGLEAAHRLHRRDLVGVDVVLDERDGDAGMGRERLHQACLDMSCRTSAMRPTTAVAAAVAGLTRCVRTLGPWRCSKLRLVVETQRSPGSPRSPLPPAHMEQPDSPHKNPASRNMRSSPAFSAARFTVVDPGTTIAMTPAATCRPASTP